MYEKPHHRLLQMLNRGKKKLSRDFWALHDVSFEVRKGETIGIIGRNGSGKSTLLQLICGTLNPTSGEVHTSGRIAALLELGSGFNPEFTGRENVFLNAALLGLTRDEISERYESIVEFADIGDFIDQPVKTYSSGMIVRLAFAVQAQISPDILIVDEALAVGDARFQAKCFARLNQLKDQGTSILLVTHSSEQIVSHCSRAILLDGGRMIDSGEPRAVVNRYLDLLFGTEPSGAAPSRSMAAEDSIKGNSKGFGGMLSCTEDLFDSRQGYNPHEYRWGDGRARILDFYLCADGVPFPPVVELGQRICMGLSVEFRADVLAPVLGITIKTKEGITVYGTNSEMLNVAAVRSSGGAGAVMQVEAAFNCQLAAGDYFISVGVASRDGQEVVPLDRRYDAIHLQVVSPQAFYGLVDLGLTLTPMEGGR
jgi:lipopolysaccharide transport system ATP-binding protein